MISTAFYINICNVLIFYIITLYVFRLTYHQEERCYKFPAYAPVDARPETDHVFNVGAKSISSVDPTDRDGFCQNGEQHRVSGRVSIQQVEKVKSTLHIKE